MLQYLITTEKTLYSGDGDKRMGSGVDDSYSYYKRLHTNLRMVGRWRGGRRGLSTEEGKDR
jgi:hypothetical protein